MDTLSGEMIRELEEFSLTANEECLSKMVELCRVYHLTPEELVETWIAFAVSNGNADMKLSLAMLENMENEELMKKPKEKTQKHHKVQNSFSSPTYNAATIDLANGNGYNMSNQNTPHHNKHLQLSNMNPSSFSPQSFSPSRATPAAKYGSRTSPGEIVCSFGEGDVNWKHHHEFSCSITLYSEEIALKERYSFMFEKIRDTASVLNDMIGSAALVYQEKYNIEEWGHIQMPSVEDVPVIGRICSDSSGKLNGLSVLFEGSQEISSGQVVPLDISKLEKFSLFPGQIVAGCGINNLGKKMLLKSIYEDVLPPLPAQMPDLSNCLESLSIVIAAGPFTTSDTLSYEPLTDLLKYVKIHEPHVCILIGPLVDIKHENIENGRMPNTYEELFRDLIISILSNLEEVNTKVVLVPSTRDAHHDFVYPTPPYLCKQLSKKIFLASDPCILKIEGVVFGITSTDVLFHLGKEEINFPPQSSDRLGRLCGHLFSQKNFYPLYPPNEEVNIDYMRFELHAMLPVMPHIMILPSDLRYFVKDVNGCCCINPQRLTKHFSGGTFARLKVKSSDKSNYTGSVINNMKVEIVKI